MEMRGERGRVSKGSGCGESYIRCETFCLSVGCVVLNEEFRLLILVSSLSFQTEALIWSRQMSSTLQFNQNV